MPPMELMWRRRQRRRERTVDGARGESARRSIRAPFVELDRIQE
jgi:hypothetical protein